MKKLDDIGNLLSDRINQKHYIMQYLRKIFNTAYIAGYTAAKKNFCICGNATWVFDSKNGVFRCASCKRSDKDLNFDNIIAK